MDSVKKGRLGLVKAIAKLEEIGYNVSIPLVDTEEYDLVVEKDYKFFGIQVKYTSKVEPSGGYSVHLHGVRTTGNSVIMTFPTNYDFLFICCTNETYFLIPQNKLKDLTSIVVGCKKWNEYKV